MVGKASDYLASNPLGTLLATDALTAERAGDTGGWSPPGLRAYILSTFSADVQALLDDASLAVMRATLGLVIGTNVQAYHAILAALSGVSSATDTLPYFTGASTASVTAFTAAARTLLDDTTYGAMRTTMQIYRSVALAGLAALTPVANETVLITDSDGGPASIVWNGTGWMRVDEGGYKVRTNIAATLTYLADAKNQYWNSPLTADRAATLSTTNAIAGAEFEIVRSAAATGAFNLNVGTGPLKALTPGTGCLVRYNGSAWYLARYWTL